jgi:AcrR family transcriptional regulator
MRLSVELFVDDIDASIRFYECALQARCLARAKDLRCTPLHRHRYAHFPTREQLLEALVERAVQRATASLETAQPDVGSAVAALERMVAASMHELGRHVAIAEAAAQQLTPDALRRAHETTLASIRRLIDRGRRTGEFRSDLPADWQVSSCYALLHAAGEDVRVGRADSATALDALTRSLHALMVPRNAG